MKRLLFVLLLTAIAVPAGETLARTAGGPATPPTPDPKPAAKPSRASTPTPPATPAPEAPKPPRVIRGVQGTPAPFLFIRREPRDIDRKLSVSPKGTVRIVNLAGSVVVSGWSENQVRVTGTLGGGVRKMIFTREGDEVNIQVVPRQNYPVGDDSDLEIQVPAGCRLDLKTFSASIEVSGVTGAVDVETMSGAVEVSGAPRQLQAECISCDMQLDVASEMIRAENMKGAISVNSTKGFMELSTVSGMIEVEAGRTEEVTLTAVSGTIGFRGQPVRTGSLVFRTHSGPIDLTFPGNLSADFDVVSYNGPIESDFGSIDGSATKVGKAREEHFTVGSGGARINIETFSGPINLNKE